MLSGEKILITGPAGRIASDITKKLVGENDVWGIGRFNDAGQRAAVEALGVTTRRVDLLDCDFGDLPQDFTYVLHIAASFDDGPYDRAIAVNSEATGFVLEHCRSAKAALVMSSVSVYAPHEDPWHQFTETDPLGDMIFPMPRSYPVSKIGSEIVARYCSRSFGLPVVIARMNAAYNQLGGLQALHLQAIADARPINVRWDPQPYSPIHGDDIANQVEALLDAATTPATIVNWGSDEMVSVQEWTAYIGDLLGVSPTIMVNPVVGSSRGAAADPAKRRSITGPSSVSWKEGIRRLAESLYPERVRSGSA